MNTQTKKRFLILFSVFIVILILCFIRPVKYRIRLNKANAIVEKHKTENVSYDYIVKQLGEPFLKKSGYAEFYIKPDRLYGLAYCALAVELDEENNIKTIEIIHPD